ncbi:hypothetical protein BH09VER1_BH09VER1_04710 [soil metagenome]
MKINLKLALTALSGAGLLSLGMPQANAADGTWISTSNQTWGTSANWSGASYPNAIDAVATFDSAVGLLATGNLSVQMGATKTVGTLNIVNNSANSLTLNAASGTTAINSLTFDVSSGNATLTVSGTGTQLNRISAPVVLNDTLNLIVSNTTASTAIFFSSTSAISGTGGIVKSGAGTVNFDNGMTYSGGLTVTDGTVITNASGASSGTSGPFGTGILTLQNGTLRASGTTGRSYYNAVNITGNFTFGGGTGTGTQSFLATAGNSTTLSVSSTLNTYSDVTFDQNIVGSGTGALAPRLAKSGAGTLVLSGSNSNIGGFTVTQGVLEFGGVSTMGGTVGGSVGSYVADFFRLDGGTIRFTSTVNSVPLTGNRGFTLGAAGGTIEVSTGVILNANGRFVESAPGATLVKTGSGTYIMGAGTSTYTGATTVSQGTLLIDATANLASSAVTVAAGATFGGLGTVGGPVTVNGTLSPGITASGTSATDFGTFTVANSLTLGSSSAVTLQLGGVGLGNYDRIAGITNLTLDGTVTVSLSNGYVVGYGDSFQLFAWSGSLDSSGFVLGSDLVLPTLTGGLNWDTSSFLTNGTISAVPEPATSSLILGSVGMVLAATRFMRGRRQA